MTDIPDAKQHHHDRARIDPGHEIFTAVNPPSRPAPTGHPEADAADLTKWEHQFDYWREIQTPVVNLILRCIQLEGELSTERNHADGWQKLAGRYDEIRDWLRICQDTPEGHAQFYDECARLIFPDSYPPDEDDNERTTA
jgi:hypothetical protein